MGVPAVSVIMPCYNHGRFLGEAVASVRAQSFSDYEIVIVDDGSDDPETKALLARDELCGARVIRAAHGGVTRARNLGVAESLGRYLTFFDCDDRMRPAFLERTVALLDADPTLAFASCWVRLFGDESWDWKPLDWGFPALLHECTIATAALVRRSVIGEVGGFDPAFELGHEDWDLWLRIVERGHRGTIIPEVLFEYRRAGESRSTVADRAATYVELYRDRIDKHEALYRRHLFGVLWLKENAEIGPQLCALAQAHDEIDTLEPEVRRLEKEVERAFVRSRSR